MGNVYLRLNDIAWHMKWDNTYSRDEWQMVIALDNGNMRGGGERLHDEVGVQGTRTTKKTYRCSNVERGE